MTRNSKKFKYSVEFEFANLDEKDNRNDVELLQTELNDNMSIILSRILRKYSSIVGFKQDFEETTNSRGGNV